MTEIEKMAEVIATEIVNKIAVDFGERCQDCDFANTNNIELSIDSQAIATALHKAGYRKQSDTVKEFAEKVAEAMQEHAVQHGYDPEGLPYYTVDIAVLQIEIEQQAEQYGKEEEEE